MEFLKVEKLAEMWLLHIAGWVRILGIFKEMKRQSHRMSFTQIFDPS